MRRRSGVVLAKSFRDRSPRGAFTVRVLESGSLALGRRCGKESQGLVGLGSRFWQRVSGIVALGSRCFRDRSPRESFWQRVSGIVLEALLRSPILDECRARVVEAGCEVLPGFANGAKCFVPLTAQQMAECSFELQPQHVVALQGGRSLLERALADVPSRKRLQLKMDQRAETKRTHPTLGDQDSPEVGDGHPSIVEDAQLGRLLIRHTFIHYQSPAGSSEASVVCQSAPCGTSGAPEPSGA